MVFSLIRDLRAMGRIFPAPLTMDFVQGMPRRALTADEQAKPYSKYYNKPLAEIPAADLERVNSGPVDPEATISIHERERMIEPDYLEVETGYTVLPDRSGFAATSVRMPGVTPEMLDWWFNWHPLESLRYAIWCPVAHDGISVKDPAVHYDGCGKDLATRNHGRTHYPVEGFDLATASTLRIEFFSPTDYGLDESKMVEPNIAAAYLANVLVDKNNLAINVFFHAIRRVEDGVEFRSRYWLGYTMVDGQPRRKNRFVPKSVMMHMARNNCIHSLTEYNNLASFLPQLYEEMRGKIQP